MQGTQASDQLFPNLHLVSVIGSRELCTLFQSRLRHSGYQASWHHKKDGDHPHHKPTKNETLSFLACVS